MPVELSQVKFYHQRKLLISEALERYFSRHRIPQNNVLEKFGSLFEIMDDEGFFDLSNHSVCATLCCVRAMIGKDKDDNDPGFVGAFGNTVDLDHAFVSSLRSILKLIPCTKELERMIENTQLSVAEWDYAVSSAGDDIDVLERNMHQNMADLLDKINTTPFIRNMVKAYSEIEQKATD